MKSKYPLTKISKANHKKLKTSAIANKSPKKPKLDLEEINTKIVDMLNRHSPLDLTFSKVSRWTKVPRSTLYYYYGNSREKMILAAVSAAVKDFLVLGGASNFSKFDTWFDLQFHLLSKASKLVDRFPWAPELYYRFRLDPSYIGQAVRDIEEKYFFERTQGWNYFYPDQKPDWIAVRMASVMKLGLLYGFQIDNELWCGEANLAKRSKLIGFTTEYLKKILETSWAIPPGQAPLDQTP
jgi:hypothetical protein